MVEACGFCKLHCRVPRSGPPWRKETSPHITDATNFRPYINRHCQYVGFAIGGGCLQWLAVNNARGLMQLCDGAVGATRGKESDRFAPPATAPYEVRTGTVLPGGSRARASKG